MQTCCSSAATATMATTTTGSTQDANLRHCPIYACLNIPELRQVLFTAESQCLQLRTPVDIHSRLFA
ncbi:hypothetical protein BLOT_012765 [Blomia tropicalis]|nr:hypothetical protein BLOT_012765 [Blomia tropicalis]